VWCILVVYIQLDIIFFCLSFFFSNNHFLHYFFYLHLPKQKLSSCTTIKRPLVLTKYSFWTAAATVLLRRLAQATFSWWVAYKSSLLFLTFFLLHILPFWVLESNTQEVKFAKIIWLFDVSSDLTSLYMLFVWNKVGSSEEDALASTLSNGKNSKHRPVLYTPGLGRGSILPGITRASLISLAIDAGYEVRGSWTSLEYQSSVANQKWNQKKTSMSTHDRPQSFGPCFFFFSCACQFCVAPIFSLSAPLCHPTYCSTVHLFTLLRRWLKVTCRCVLCSKRPRLSVVARGLR